MKVLTKVGTALVLAAAACAPACGSDEKKSDDGGGGDAGVTPDSSDGTGGSGGRSSGTGGASTSTGGTSGGGTMCGGETCDLGAQGMFATACCTDDDACGMQSPLASGCIALDQPGGIDPACEGFEAMGFTLPGCCGENGCGALLGAGTCASNEQLGVDPVDCDFDPNNTCTALMEIPCDGAEDCPSGQQCCGKVEGTTYTQIGCFDSCDDAAADAGMGTLYLELCHAGDTCTNAAYSCGTSQYLPPYLLRCYSTAGEPTGTLSSDADEVNCGEATCGAGEKCCIRSPKDPYCAPAGEDCTCTLASELPEAGAPDAAPEAAPADAAAPDAAASDASGD